MERHPPTITPSRLSLIIENPTSSASFVATQQQVLLDAVADLDVDLFKAAGDFRVEAVIRRRGHWLTNDSMPPLRSTQMTGLSLAGAGAVAVNTTRTAPWRLQT